MAVPQQQSLNTDNKKQQGINDTDYPALKECLERNRDQILNRPGVTGVGIGYKVTGGKETDQLAIVICVKEKQPEQELASDAILPKEIEGHVTDVKTLMLTQPPGYWDTENTMEEAEEVA